MSTPTTLFGFRIDKNELNHEKCVAEHCLKQNIVGHKACIHARLAKRLTTLKSYPENALSDWQLLNNALKTSEEFSEKSTLRTFSKSNSHRLRYEIHQQLGKDFILKLLTSIYSLVWEWDPRLAQKMSKYTEMFYRLHDREAKSGCGEIYRLYDLMKGEINIKPEMLDTQSCLSLVFALGYYNPSKNTLCNNELSDLNEFPQTIRELVTKYEFFYEFAKKKIKSTSGQYKYFTKQVQAKYLSHSIPCITKLWNYYAHISSSIFSVDTKAILNDAAVIALYEEKMPSRFSDKQLKEHLKAVFTQNIRQKHIPSLVPVIQSPLPFTTGFEAVYHPFKHMDASSDFFQGAELEIAYIETLSDQGLYTYAWESTTDYLRMIKDIIANDEDPKKGIDQFTGGTIFTYQKKQHIDGEEMIFNAIVKSHPNGVSYLLTCY